MAFGEAAGMAAAPQDVIAKILARRELEQRMALEQAREQRAQTDSDRRYQLDLAQEERLKGERQQQLDINRETLDSLREGRTAAAAKAQAEADTRTQGMEREREQRQKMAEFIAGVKGNPNATREERMMALSLTHYLLTGKTAEAGLFKDPEEDFNKFRRQADYNDSLVRRREDDRRNTPKPVRDDPTLPNGVKQWLIDVSMRNGDNYASAQKEVRNGLASVAKDHPNMNEGKVYDMLRKMYAKPAGSNRVDIQSLIQKSMSAQPDDE